MKSTGNLGNDNDAFCIRVEQLLAVFTLVCTSKTNKELKSTEIGTTVKKERMWSKSEQNRSPKQNKPT
jgi:hypothetical protein